MSNSVSTFTFNSSASRYFLESYNKDFSAFIVFSTNPLHPRITLKSEYDNSFVSRDLNKDQITHLLSLDCPDAFIAYALTLCPLSPENSTSNNRRLVCADKELMGGNLLRPARSYPKKQDITYLQALKDIKAQIEFLNKCAFDKSILTSDEHFALLAIEEELRQLIHFDPIRPDDGLPLRYDVFSIVNGSQLPDNLE